MSVLIEFSVFPMDKGESVGEYVSAVVSAIDGSGADYRLTPMGTIVETATVEEALAFVADACKLLGGMDCRRVYASCKLDIRDGNKGRLTAKTESVRRRLGRVKT